MKTFTIIKQGIREGQQETQWHTKFLIAITPVTFAYCALFPFSPESGPGLLQIAGLLPLAGASLLWAGWKSGSKNVVKLVSVLPQEVTPLVIDIKELQVRIDKNIKEVENKLSRVSNGRKQTVKLRTECIKLRSQFVRRGDAKSIRKVSENQQQLEALLRNWNRLEEEIFELLEKLADSKREVATRLITVQMLQAIESALKMLDSQIMDVEQKQKSAKAIYHKLQTVKSMTA